MNDKGYIADMNEEKVERVHVSFQTRYGMDKAAVQQAKEALSAQRWVDAVLCCRAWASPHASGGRSGLFKDTSVPHGRIVNMCVPVTLHR